MEKSKVSILMPCYNGSATIEQAIRGILGQTYRPIEFILVNDGSTDGSDLKIQSIANEIEASGIEFKYIIQKNKGLGGAINTGLKQVTGKYLAWCDADDELFPTSVEKRVKFLDAHPEYGSVSSNAVSFCPDDKNTTSKYVTTNIHANSEENQFEHLLMGRSILCAGCHLVRTDVFLRSHGKMEIYPARHGQNWQMLLPVYYISKHAFLNEPLYRYRIDPKSMSSNVVSMPLKSYCKRQREYIKIVQATLRQISSLPHAEYRKYMMIFRKRVYEQNLDAAIIKGTFFDQFFWKCAVKYSITILSLYTIAQKNRNVNTK